VFTYTREHRRCCLIPFPWHTMTSQVNVSSNQRLSYSRFPPGSNQRTLRRPQENADIATADERDEYTVSTKLCTLLVARRSRRAPSQVELQLLKWERMTGACVFRPEHLFREEFKLNWCLGCVSYRTLDIC
jgi:hypothetical protein